MIEITKGRELIIATDADGGLLVNLRSGDYFALNKTASLVLLRYIQGCTPEAIADEISVLGGSDTASVLETVREAIHRGTGTQYKRLIFEDYLVEDIDSQLLISFKGQPLLAIDVASRSINLVRQCSIEELTRHTRALAPNFLAIQGVVVLHAASVHFAGEGVHLICGPSGAGKTTLANVLGTHGATITSEDKVVLQRDLGSFAFCPNAEDLMRRWADQVAESLSVNALVRIPTAPDFGAPPVVTIAGIWFLSQAQRLDLVEISLKDIGVIDTAARLMGQLFDFRWTAESIEQQLTSALQLANAVRAQVAFVPNTVETMTRAAQYYMAKTTS